MRRKKGKLYMEKEYKKKFCIYKIVDKNTNNVIYIGQTTNTLHRRLIQHHSGDYTYPDRQISKYDFDDLDILPIVDCSTQDEADKLEKLYTEMYEKDYDLLNVKKANDPPPEIKEKISNTLKKTLNL